MAAGIERDAFMLFTISRIGGVIGSIEWLDEQIKIAEKNETGASFDSELSLVMWPDDYQLLRYQPNYERTDIRQLAASCSRTARSWFAARRPDPPARQGVGRYGHQGRS